MDPMNADELYPIAILMDELKSEDVERRLNAIHRISTIALALGPERARDELIPFLQDSVDDEDEVLLALAAELGQNFEEYLGGPDYAYLLLGPLETLAAVEETLVRDKATESATKIAGILSQAHVEEYFVPLLKRLSSGEWFTSRTSSASLYSPIYPRVNDQIKEEMRRGFNALANDDTPMVRRAAGKWLGPFVEKMSKEHVLSDALPIYRKLANDDQDSVRLLTIQDLIVIARQLGPKDTKAQVLGQLRQSVSDKSWRVRYMVANHFVELAEAVGSEIVNEELVSAYVQLLKDNEAEVRTAGAGQIPGFAKLVEREVIVQRLLPCVRDLASDSSQHVRAALALHISGLAALVGKESTVEDLLPIFLQLLKDEFPDVRLNIIGKLDVDTCQVIGVELLSTSLLPAIYELAEDKQWRVRQAIIEYIPLLATQLGKQFFDDQLAQLCLSWLGDNVYSIREAAILNLKKLALVFGDEWAKAQIVPKLVAMGSHPNYLFRITAVLAIPVIVPILNSESNQELMTKVLFPLMADPIPNIRFNVAKSLEVMAQQVATTDEGRELGRSTIIPAVERLKNDADMDVRYFANRALQKTVMLVGAA
ncbi:Ser/Thr protein phosphatase 2A regulatory subunit A [Auricularia subglabra TFB-10046 SS5]|nr:Ser/Thr protein phosphatase 2A regulatory subunit A [Auricularia subglabra TFB-10046 SS5]